MHRRFSAAGQLASQQAQNAPLPRTERRPRRHRLCGSVGRTLWHLCYLRRFSSGTSAGADVGPRPALIQDAARQDQINANREYFDDTNNARWKQLGIYQSIVPAIAGLAFRHWDTCQRLKRRSRAYCRR